MLNDINLQTLDKDTVDTITTTAKAIFSETTPYQIFPSSLSRTDQIVVFSQHFINVFRLVLSNPDGGCIVQMSSEEREVYYSYIDFQNSVPITDAEMLLVVEELDNCIVNEIECKVSTYLDQCFSEEHTWDTCPVATDETPKHKELTQTAYDALEYVSDVTLYIITNNGITVKIMVGTIMIWEAV